MKLPIISALVFVLVVPLFSQGYYPLQIGNMWQYRDSYDSTYGWTHSAVKDTVMQNGYAYTAILGDNPGSYFDGYYRQGDSRVFYFGSYSTSDSSEDLWYDFSKTTGDTVRVTILSTPNGIDTVTVRVMNDEMLNVFGELRRTWTFYEESKRTSVRILRLVADSIGLIHVSGEGGIAFTLNGAIINSVRYGTIVGVASLPQILPDRCVLYQNFPNPCNPSTVIRLMAPIHEHITLAIYDVLGKRVRVLFAGMMRSGMHDFVWDGKNDIDMEVSSGVYFYQLRSDRFTETKGMLLVK